MWQHKRTLVWFSCGAASAIAAKLALKKYAHTDIHIVYTDTGSEHPDNERFLRDCEAWFNHPVVRLKSDKYKDIWDVFDKTRYLVGVSGARCTTELKKRLRQDYEDLETDLQIFGFDLGEVKRGEFFQQNNPEVHIAFPLIEEGIMKADCIAILRKAKIEIPEMYKLGYRNNNCIGCVKGQGGYWNKIRKDFPDVFERMAKVERNLNVAINKTYAKDKKRKRLFLDEMPEDFGRYNAEPDIECGILCGSFEVE